MADQSSERRGWFVWAFALLALVIVLLLVLFMIGIPYLNANLVRGSGLSSGDLASWQVTSLVTMVGMLIGGVFIITAFRVDSTAKYTASVEARELIEREVTDKREAIEKLLKDGKDDMAEVVDQGKSRINKVVQDGAGAVAQGKSDIASVVNTGNSKIGDVVEKGQSDIANTVQNGTSDFKAAVERGNAAIDRVVQDAGVRTTAAIDSESGRFRQATEVAVAGSERELRRLMDQVQADNRAVREFFDEQAPDVVRETFTAEQTDAIRNQVVADSRKNFWWRGSAKPCGPLSTSSRIASSSRWSKGSRRWDGGGGCSAAKRRIRSSGAWRNEQMPLGGCRA